MGGDPFYIAKHARSPNGSSAPACGSHSFREFAEVGGGCPSTNIANTYRQVGIYVSRILNGASPPTAGVSADYVRTGDQPESRKSYRAFNPTALLLRADEVIE